MKMLVVIAFCSQTHTHQSTDAPSLLSQAPLRPSLSTPGTLQTASIPFIIVLDGICPSFEWDHPREWKV